MDSCPRRGCCVLSFKMLRLCVFLLIRASAVARTETAADPDPDPVLDSDSYVAAVYEHNVILNPEPHVAVSRRDALQHMRRNLDIYEEQAARAARQVRSDPGRRITSVPETVNTF